MRAMATALALMLAAAPAHAQDAAAPEIPEPDMSEPDMSAIDACAAATFGTGDCTVEAAQEALFNLYPGYVRDFHDAGMESFAMLTVLSIIGDGLTNRLDNGDCIFNDEIAGDAKSIWAEYVALPDGAPPRIAERVTTLDRFVQNAAAYILEGTC